MAKYSIFQQIDNAERELVMRQRVYPGRIASKKMTQAEADYLIGCQEATIKTLELVRDYQEEIRSLVTQAKQPRLADGNLSAKDIQW